MARSSPQREAKRLEVEQRRREVLQLRVEGKSMAEIAEALQLSKSTVHGHVTRALSDLAKADLDRTGQYRALATQRYEGLLKAIWPHATGQLAITTTRTTKDGDTITTTVPAIDVKATREARFLVTALARLLGLEAPIKITHTDPTGDIERSPHDWIMPVPPERDPHEWAEQTRRMLADRETAAERMVEELLGKAREESQPQPE